MKRSVVVRLALAAVLVFVGIRPSAADPVPGTPVPNISVSRPPVTRTASIPRDTIKIRAVLTHVDCLAESEWDRFSNSDEPLLIVAGFKHPGAQTGSSGYHIFSDVDSGETRTIPANLSKAVPPASGYIAYATPGGVIPAYAAGEDTSMTELIPGDMVGFDVRIFEHDDANEADITGTIAGMTEDMAATLHDAPSVIGDVLGFFGDVINGCAQAIAALADAILGSGDDYVGGHTVLFHRQLGDSPPALPESVRTGAEVLNIADLPTGDSERWFFIDGGSEGCYMLFYRVTKTVIPPAATTTVQGQPVSQPSGQQAGPITVQGQAVDHPTGTVRQVSPPTSDTFAMTRDSTGESAPLSLSPLGVRADRVHPGDLLGDYRLYLDGIPFKLHLGDVNLRLEDMTGRRFNITGFVTEGYRFEFAVPSLRPGQSPPPTLNGYLLTHTKDAIAGTFKAGGKTYGFYAVKYKSDSEPKPLPTRTLPPEPKTPLLKKPR